MYEFLTWAEKQGWHIKETKQTISLPDEIMQRYSVPSEWLAFIRTISLCSNPNETCWFLTAEDYAPGSHAFVWNEFELQSLQAADDDALRNQIKAYWAVHLPIMICTEGNYAYYAINTENGCIVYGEEPEYEESEMIARSFEEFLQKLIS